MSPKLAKDPVRNRSLESQASCGCASWIQLRVPFWRATGPLSPEGTRPHPLVHHGTLARRALARPAFSPAPRQCAPSADRGDRPPPDRSIDRCGENERERPSPRTGLQGGCRTTCTPTNPNRLRRSALAVPRCYWKRPVRRPVSAAPTRLAGKRRDRSRFGGVLHYSRLGCGMSLLVKLALSRSVREATMSSACRSWRPTGGTAPSCTLRPLTAFTRHSRCVSAS